MSWDWSEQPENLRPILETFAELAGFTPANELKRTWIHGAREWYETFRGDTALLRQAVGQMIAGGLTCKSPQSAISTAQTIKMGGMKAQKLGLVETPVKRSVTAQDQAMELARMIEARMNNLTNLTEREMLYALIQRYGFDRVQKCIEANEDIKSCAAVYNAMVVRPVARGA